jgi:hypothetical protein
LKHQKERVEKTSPPSINNFHATRVEYFFQLINCERIKLLIFRHMLFFSLSISSLS